VKTEKPATGKMKNENEAAVWWIAVTKDRSFINEMDETTVSPTRNL